MTENQKNIYIISSIAFFIFSCFVFYFIYRQIRIKNIDAEEIKIQIQNENKKYNDIEILSKSNKISVEDQISFDSHFVDKSEIANFFDSLEKLAEKIKLETEILSANEDEIKGDFTLELKSKGSFENIYRFLLLLENSQYMIEIMSINMQKEHQDETQNITKNPIWTLHLKIKLLSFVK